MNPARGPPAGAWGRASKCVRWGPRASPASLEGRSSLPRHDTMQLLSPPQPLRPSSPARWRRRRSPRRSRPPRSELRQRWRAANPHSPAVASPRAHQHVTAHRLPHLRVRAIPNPTRAERMGRAPEMRWCARPPLSVVESPGATRGGQRIQLSIPSQPLLPSPPRWRRRRRRPSRRPRSEVAPVPSPNVSGLGPQKIVAPGGGAGPGVPRPSE